MSAARVQPGQVWRRKKDGVETTVTGVQNDWYSGYVVHQTSRRVYTQTASFLRKYELVRAVAS